MHTKTGISRRQFLLTSALASAGVAAVYYNRDSHIASLVLGANDRVRVATIGLGTKGLRHLDQLVKMAGVEVAAICDIDDLALKQAGSLVISHRHRPPLMTHDYRHILDQKDIDIVTIATPRTLHAPMTISSCQAAKNVYLEKPCATTLGEGRKLLDAAKASGRLVQQGSTTRFYALGETLFSQLADPENIHRARGIRRITGARTFSVTGKNEVTPNSWNELCDDLIDDLDFARTLMGVGLPNYVSAIALRNSWHKQSDRLALRLTFGLNDEKQRLLEFEVHDDFSSNTGADNRRGDQRSRQSPHARQGPTVESELVFESTKGSFVFRSTGPNLEAEDQDSIANLISAVRADSPQSLVYPLEESRISCALAQLVSVALYRKSGFNFDPSSERSPSHHDVNSMLLVD